MIEQIREQQRLIREEEERLQKERDVAAEKYANQLSDATVRTVRTDRPKKQYRHAKENHRKLRAQQMIDAFRTGDSLTGAADVPPPPVCDEMRYVRNDDYRAPIVCVLGHVDSGKTAILDKLRGTNVQNGESGGITQQIGATYIPLKVIVDRTKMCNGCDETDIKIPGILIIDTPGHEYFNGLRHYGASICDIAILVVDITRGIETQTLESLRLLRANRTPFVVALNKIDRLYRWKSDHDSDIAELIKTQHVNVNLEFDDRVKFVTTRLSELGLNSALFYENDNMREYVSLIPTSAITGDGIGNMIWLLCELTQTLLRKRIAPTDDVSATVMEVKTVPGLGQTIDVIVITGSLSEGDTIVTASQDGPIVTQIRSLMVPQTMKDIRTEGCEYRQEKTVIGTRCCKIVGKNLGKCLSGLPIIKLQRPDMLDTCKNQISTAMADVLRDIKVVNVGILVHASTFGSLHAILDFLTKESIPVSSIDIGPVHKRSVAKASIMLEHDNRYATILAFDVTIDRDAQEFADKTGVRIFYADVIYHLFDKFTSFLDTIRKQNRDRFRNDAVYPCKLRPIPSCIFKTRNPIIIGVRVHAGFLKIGTELVVASKELMPLGRVSSIEKNNKRIDRADTGDEVCIKIDAGEISKTYGRHFDATDTLISKITRQSLDVVTNYFYDDLSSADWELMKELEKSFAI